MLGRCRHHARSAGALTTVVGEFLREVGRIVTVVGGWVMLALSLFLVWLAFTDVYFH